MRKTITSIVFIVVLFAGMFVYNRGNEPLTQDVYAESVSNVRDEAGQLIPENDLFLNEYLNDDVTITFNGLDTITINNNRDSNIYVADTFVFDKYINGTWYLYYVVENDFFSYFRIDESGTNERFEALNEEEAYALFTRLETDFFVGAYQSRVINFDNVYQPNLTSGTYRLRLPVDITTFDSETGTSNIVLYDLTFGFVVE